VTGQRAIVLGAGLVLFALIAASPGGLAGNFRKTWEAGATLLGLSLLSDVAPEIAAPLAVLVVLAVAVRGKSQLGAIVSGSQSKTTATKTNVQPKKPGAQTNA